MSRGTEGKTSYQLVVRGELDERFAYLLGGTDEGGRPTDEVLNFIEGMDELMREIEGYLAFWSIACGE